MSWVLQLVLALAIFTAGGAAGIKWHAGVDAQRELAAHEAQAERRRTDEKAASAASTAFEKDRTQNETRTRTVYVEVDKIIDRPVYRTVCVDADGLRLLNDQIRRADNAGQPGGPLPGSGAGG